MIMKTKMLFPIALLGATTLFTACEKDDKNGPDNEQELITTVRLTFTSTGGTAIFKAVDKDGDGGLAPQIDPVALKANTDYTLKVEFLDESGSSAKDITTEVKSESAAHLICYTVSGGMPAPQIQDKDGDGKPLGLESKFKTGAAGAGALKVTLKHEADKNSANACNTGETDAEVTFSVTVAN